MPFGTWAALSLRLPHLFTVDSSLSPGNHTEIVGTAHRLAACRLSSGLCFLPLAICAALHPWLANNTSSLLPGSDMRVPSHHRGRFFVGRLFPLLGVPTVLRKLNTVFVCVNVINQHTADQVKLADHQSTQSFKFSAFWYSVVTFFGWFRVSLLPYPQSHSTRTNYLLKTL